MANKFTNFIFTTEGKDTITQVLAAKKVAVNSQLSINTVYTFATKLSTSLVYTQISSLGPKQTKPVGTVTPQSNDTVEMRIQLDNADLTTGYNLQGVAIVGQYNGNNFVLGYINSNETTNIPPYDGTQVQTVALDVSFAISDSNIVTINTQTAGMLTVDDYNALVKLLETRVAPLAVDSTVVHLTGSEVVTGIKQFTERIVGSVTGNAHTADYLNVHNLTADISLDSLSDNGSYLSKSNTKVTTGKPSGTSELYTLIVAGTMQLFNDMSNDALYVRNRIDSKTMTSWKKIVEDVDQTLNAKYNYAQLPTVNGSGVALQSDLAAETNSRSVADRDLKTSIALEAQTRSAADIAFGSSLAAEVATRSTADASVTAAMTKEQATRSTADASITANLTAETSARSAADTSLKALYSGLNSDFNDETSTRSAADSLLLGSTADLASQIAKERDNRVFNDNSLASGLVSEAAKRDELFGSMGDTIKATSNTIASVNAGAVHKTGAETIAGDKTFTNPINGQLVMEPFNLLHNTEFENNLSGWNIINNGGNATVVDSVSGYGHKYARISAGDTALTENAYLEQIVTNVTSAYYTLSFYGWASALNANGAGGWIVEADSSGKETSSTFIDFGASTSWTRYYITFTPGSTTRSLKIRFKLNRNKSNISVGFSMPQLEPSNAPSAYVRGSDMQVIPDDTNVVHKTGNETITGQKNFKGTQSFENLSVSGTAKLPAGFDGGFVRYTGVFADWNLLWEYQMSGNSATFLLSGTALKDVTASDPADILLTTITKYPVPKSTARGFIIDVTTGANFGSLRMYSDGRVAMNWNAANVAISGHYIEGSISFLIS